MTLEVRVNHIAEAILSYVGSDATNPATTRAHAVCKERITHCSHLSIYLLPEWVSYRMQEAGPSKIEWRIKCSSYHKTVFERGLPKRCLSWLRFVSWISQWTCILISRCLRFNPATKCHWQVQPRQLRRQKVTLVYLKCMLKCIQMYYGSLV